LFNSLHILCWICAPLKSPNPLFSINCFLLSIFFYRSPFSQNPRQDDFFLDSGEIWTESWGFPVRFDRSVGKFLGFGRISNVDFLNLEVCGELKEALAFHKDCNWIRGSLVKLVVQFQLHWNLQQFGSYVQICRGFCIGGATCKISSQPISEEEAFSVFFFGNAVIFSKLHWFLCHILEIYLDFDPGLLICSI
jgi:hypothetical protein